MKIYNTLTRQKEEFKSIKAGQVSMYTCGPTVYWFAHVGMFRSYVFADVLKRVLTYNGYKVKQVINITDVGHLTTDEDFGDDKIEKAALKEGKNVEDIAKFYFDSFHEDFLKVNLIEPFKWVKATLHIKEQIDLIKKLEKKGYTYKTTDGIYFDTSKDIDYGKLSKKNIEGLEGGKRTDMREKKNKTDFALWKFSGDESRLQEWASPWGVGFPGWHLECSAMATKYLGKNFDIHTGGIDLIPIHHENEIAQSECGYGVKNWVRYWMHGAFLTLDGGKMSKSTGKIKTISGLEKDGIDPLAYRYFTFSAHYRKPLTWSEDAIKTAVNSYSRLKSLVLKLEDDLKTNEKYLKSFKEKIDDDLDMPGAVAILWKLIRDKKASGKVGTIKRMDEVFGLKLFETLKIEIPNEILKLAEERKKVRDKKNWERGDEVRDELEKNGWWIRDIGEDFILGKINK